ncbi:MAG TPA: ATP-binding cassette domain-containing protein [Chlamydiales bacterium]|nr:ATP-binding cassette domain-containing protein [Chlamydiales bacterium]
MIKIENLHKSYGNLEVLKGLNLEVKQGEILVILGRSGVGKSVTLRQILGLEQPDSGRVLINDQDLAKLSEKEFYDVIRDMGMLFQSAALFDSMNIEENTGFYLKQNGNRETGKRFTKKEIEERVNEALKMVDLEGSQKSMPSDLSGGMKKRAGLARLIVYRPSILLYDEPTTGLDPITAQQINELIVATQNELQGTSIIVTHDIHSALYCADRIALHENGQIVLTAPRDEFLNIDHPTIKFLKDNLTHHPSGRKENKNAK